MDIPFLNFLVLNFSLFLLFLTDYLYLALFSEFVKNYHVPFKVANCPIFHVFGVHIWINDFNLTLGRSTI